MKREELILKWLNNELNDQELQAFKALEDYEDLITLNTNLQAFKADEYNTSTELENVLSAIKTVSHEPKKEHKIRWIKPLMRIAAILAIGFGLYYYTTTLDTKVATEVAQKTTIDLPDASSVSLNSKSLISFNKNRWEKEREVKLNGEAFFKVAKGSSFKVITNSGTVTVYGTQFNVKQRKNYFEVICYEGLVGVTHESNETKLKPGECFLIMDGKIIAKEKESLPTPSWLNNESNFKSLPYKTVLDEFERQYGVKFNSENINTNQLFTGSFTHNNIKIALKSITLPLNLTYSKTNSTITLKGE